MSDPAREIMGEIRVHSRGIGQGAAYVLLGFSLYLLLMGFINNPMESYAVTFLMSLIPILPMVFLADFLIKEVVVDNQGLTRHGLFGRKTTITWDQVVKVALIRNSAGTREMVVFGPKRKIVLSNTIFLISKPNFWEAALAVLDRADQAKRPVKAGLLGRRAWFFHVLEYLPGDKFEDRKADLGGPGGGA